MDGCVFFGFSTSPRIANEGPNRNETGENMSLAVNHISFRKPSDWFSGWESTSIRGFGGPSRQADGTNSVKFRLGGTIKQLTVGSQFPVSVFPRLFNAQETSKKNRNHMV